MATTEYEPEPPATGMRVTLIHAADAARLAVGADEHLSLRTLLLLVVVGLAGASAPMPIALIGVVATVLLTLDIARLTWKRR